MVIAVLSFSERGALEVMRKVFDQSLCDEDENAHRVVNMAVMQESKRAKSTRGRWVGATAADLIEMVSKHEQANS